MKTWRADVRWLSAGSVLFAFLAAAAALGPASVSAQSETKIRFSLDRAIDGTTAPLFLAIDKGYFKEQGLDVTVDPANATLDAITRLALGNGAAETTHDMSIADLNAMIRYRDQNPPTGIEAVFIVHDKPAYAVVGRRSRGIQFVKDTENRKLGAPAADPATQAWPLFAKLNAVDPSKVTLLNVGPQVRAPMLASGEVDAILGNSFATFVDLKDRSVAAEDIVVLLMADYGVTLYGAAILASAKFQAEQPDAIRRFLRGYVLGLRDAMQNPDEAVEAVLKRMQGGRKEVELERLRIVLTQNVKKFDAKAETVGGVDPVRFAAAFEQLGQIYSFKSKLKPEEYFDAQYLPAPPPAPKAQEPPQQQQKKKKK